MNTAKRSNKSWTQREEQVLISEIRKTPDNLRSAFERTSTLLGRSSGACEVKWYSNLKPHYNDEIFKTSSSKKKKKNGKNSVRRKTHSAVYDSLELLFGSLSHNNKKEFLQKKLIEILS